MPDPVGIEVLAHCLVGAGEQVGRWWIGHRDTTKEEAVERFTSDSRGTVAAAFGAMEMKGG